MPHQTQRIACIVGKSTYRDLRDGFTAASLTHDSDADIKAALGIAQHRVGAVAVCALETRYARTLMHERRLLGTWDRLRRGDGKEDVREHAIIILDRHAASLAIRHMAHAGDQPVADLPHYAWLLRVRRERLRDCIDECRLWLDDECACGVHAFLVALRR
jgi:hypothetical protein